MRNCVVLAGSRNIARLPKQWKKASCPLSEESVMEAAALTDSSESGLAKSIHCQSVRESTNTAIFLRNLNFALDQFANFLHNPLHESEIGPEDAPPDRKSTRLNSSH